VTPDIDLRTLSHAEMDALIWSLLPLVGQLQAALARIAELEARVTTLEQQVQVPGPLRHALRCVIRDRHRPALVVVVVVVGEPELACAAEWNRKVAKAMQNTQICESPTSAPPERSQAGRALSLSQKSVAEVCCSDTVLHHVAGSSPPRAAWLGPRVHR